MADVLPDLEFRDLPYADPFWHEVVGVQREEGGIRIRMTNVRSGDFSYLIPWQTPITFLGFPFTKPPGDLVELALGKYAKLTFDPEDVKQTVKAVEFVKEKPS